MNTPKSHLWELIDRLTPAEKRYFKTHFASTNSQLTTLYDTLNTQSTFDEQAAREILGVAPAQYKVLKHQLQELLLKSWVAINGKRSIKSKIRLGLEEVDLLLEREHFDEATKKLERLEKLCAQYGFTLYQYEVRERLHEIQHLELDFSDPDANRHYQKLVHLQRVLYQKQQLSAIQQRLEDWNAFTPARHSVLQEIKNTLEKLRAEYMDNRSVLAWMQNMAICSELLGDEAETHLCRTNILHIFSADSSFKKSLPLSYLRALKHAASPARRYLSLKEVDQIANQARRLIAQYPQYSPHYVYFLWARVRTNYEHKKWDRIVGPLETACLDHLKIYQLSAFRTALKIYVVLAVAYLLRKDYDKAAHYFAAYRKSKVTKDESLNCCVDLLELILWTEDDHIGKLRQRVVYFKRRLKHRGQEELSPLYNFHLNLFAKISSHPFEKDELTANALLEVANYPYDPILFFYSFFHIERWLQATATRQAWIKIV